MTPSSASASGSPREKRLLHFGEFCADIDGARCSGVFRGGEPLGLSDMPRRVLFVLLERRPRPVLAKELLAQLWGPGANASNVAKQVRALRTALGDERSHYIKTLNKEGYAFVMPVRESPPVALRCLESMSGPAEILVPGDLAPTASEKLPAAGETEWRLARYKLANDFAGSCLHDLELLEEALDECDRRIRVIEGHTRVRAEERFAREAIRVPPWRPVRAVQGNIAPDPAIAATFADLLAYARDSPVIVNIGAYSPACLAVLESLRRRYGLEIRRDLGGLSGRQQIIHLFHHDRADFLIAPHAPFLLVGDYGARDYRRVTPIHSYEQVVLRKPGPARRRRQRLLVYKGGSPEEQLIVRAGLPTSAEPEMVGSLQRLLELVEGLAPGDLVIAWEPLASGLTSKHPFRRFADYRCWLTLYCHKRWQRGALRPLKQQFGRLFANEWIYCRERRDWALDCFGNASLALELFAAGSGIAPSESARTGRFERLIFPHFRGHPIGADGDG